MFKSQDVIFAVPLFSGGRRTIHLRYPTDEELCARSRSLRLISRPGRPLTETDRKQNENTILEAALSLVKVLSDVDGPGGESSRGENLDSEEAIYLVDRLLRCEVRGAELVSGDLVEVSLAVANGETVKHQMRIPTKGRTMRWARQISEEKPGSGGIVWRYSLLEPHASLYDELVVSSEGYDGPVPINHKQAAVNALVDVVRELEEEAAVIHPE